MAKLRWFPLLESNFVHCKINDLVYHSLAHERKPVILGNAVESYFYRTVFMLLNWMEVRGARNNSVISRTIFSCTLRVQYFNDIFWWRDCVARLFWHVWLDVVCIVSGYKRSMNVRMRRILCRRPITMDVIILTVGQFYTSLCGFLHLPRCFYSIKVRTTINTRG